MWRWESKAPKKKPQKKLDSLSTTAKRDMQPSKIRTPARTRKGQRGRAGWYFGELAIFFKRKIRKEHMKYFPFPFQPRTNHGQRLASAHGRGICNHIERACLQADGGVGILQCCGSSISKVDANKMQGLSMGSRGTDL